MSFDEILVLVFVLGFAAWAFHSMRRGARHDADWNYLLKAFAVSRGLTAVTVERAPGEFDSKTPITWKMIKRVWSRNPAVAAPIKGSIAFKGTNRGYPFLLDEVWIRKYWANLHDAYLRMAVELPGLPATLVIYPAGRMRRSARGNGSSARFAAPLRRANLTTEFSAGATDRARERSYLTADRIRTLEELEEALGGVHIHGGKLFVIRRRRSGRQVDLDILFEALGMCARMLAK